MRQRPEHFTLNPASSLFQGLCFAGLAGHGCAFSGRYADSSPFRRNGLLIGFADPAGEWDFAPELGRFMINFDGAAYLPVPTLPNLQVGRASSGMLWAKTSVPAERRYTWADVKSDGDATYCLFTIGGKWVVSLGESYGVDAVGPNVDTDWMCLGWTVLDYHYAYYPFTGYFNGLPIGGTVGARIAGGSPTLGRAGDYAGLYWLGAISDALRWDRVLSRGEMTALADPSNVMLSGLIVPPRRRLFGVGPVPFVGAISAKRRLGRAVRHGRNPMGPIGPMGLMGPMAPISPIAGPHRQPRRLRPGRSIVSKPIPRGCRAEFRGLYRIFNAAEFRFYRSSSGPPAESDSPFATSATLPLTTDEDWTAGPWYVSVSYFNGVLDSGFLPIGPHGETCLRFDAGSGVVGQPPAAPRNVELVQTAPLAVRLSALYADAAAVRADEWAYSYTVDGSDPAADDPAETPALSRRGLDVLDVPITITGGVTVVKIRVQVRRNDGTIEAPEWVYSENSAVVSLAIDGTPPDPAEAAVVWPGRE
jgi:hypothetical protein